MSNSDPLDAYHAKRRFDQTPEPAGELTPSGEQPAPSCAPRFVIHKHAARRLHYDLRLEVDGVLKSWAVPKEPSEDPNDKRLAVHTEDHPLEYLTFAGVIPKGEYGAGTMEIWDTGTYRTLKIREGRAVPLPQTIAKGHVMIRLEGQRLRGGYHLVRTAGSDKNWLLIRMKAETEAKLLADADAVAPPAECHAERSEASRAVQGEALRCVQHDIRQGQGDGGPKTEIRAKDSPLPDWIAPMLAEPSDRPFSDPGWLFERKLDGERCLAFRQGGEVRLYSRARQPLNAQYPELVAALLDQPADGFIVDGEIVAFEGRTASFARLQHRMHTERADETLMREVPVFFYLFDLLYVRGYDLRGLELLQRKSLLRSAFIFAVPLRCTPYRTGESGESGEVAFARACRKGWEGLIAKRADSPYVSGRSRDWLKLKCLLEQEFVIGGYTAPQGGRMGFGALLLGHYDGETLLYAGKVGTGFDDPTLRALSEELGALRIDRQPFAGPPIREKGVYWVQPARVAQVAFSAWTPDGRLWHSRFIGLRRDKDPLSVVRET